MYCATGSNQSKVAHLSIPTHCSDPVTSLASSAIIPTLTLTPLSPTLDLSATVSPTPQNGAYGMENFSLIFTLILSFLPLL